MLVTAWFFGDLKSLHSGPNITEDWRFLNNLFFFNLSVQIAYYSFELIKNHFYIKQRRGHMGYEILKIETVSEFEHKSPNTSLGN
jgi:hypothetical protein